MRARSWICSGENYSPLTTQVLLTRLSKCQCRSCAYSGGWRWRPSSMHSTTGFVQFRRVIRRAAVSVEMLNAAIKGHVQHQVSHTQIRNSFANWALLESVQECLRNYVYSGRQNARRASHHADATDDVKSLVAIFKRAIGVTWAAATTPNPTSHVTEGPQRRSVPWHEVQARMSRSGADAPHAEIRRHVTPLTPFFTWTA